MSTVTPQEKEKIKNMDTQVGRRCSFIADHGKQTGYIAGVSNSEHYRVRVDHPSIWEWYVREEAIRFED